MYVKEEDHTQAVLSDQTKSASNKALAHVRAINPIKVNKATLSTIDRAPVGCLNKAHCRRRTLYMRAATEIIVISF